MKARLLNAHLLPPPPKKKKKLKTILFEKGVFLKQSYPNTQK